MLARVADIFARITNAEYPTFEVFAELFRKAILVRTVKR
jgi:hypothetical protein